MTIDQLPAPALSVERQDGRHLLWRERQDEHRIWILAEAPPTAPIAAAIPFDTQVPQRLEAVHRLWQRLTGAPAGPTILPLTRHQRRRMILMLRALDGWRDRASYRDLAAVLLDPEVRRQSRRDWLASPGRAQIIRLVRDAVRHMEGGYRDLLRGR